MNGFLEDFCSLTRNITSRPTQIAELIPGFIPATLGVCNAAGEGMSGIHFISDVLSRHKFPLWVQRDLVSFDNPDGSINNSDLELAGSIAHNDVLAQHADARERTIHNSYDNMATVFWQHKGLTTMTGPAACLLCSRLFTNDFSVMFRSKILFWAPQIPWPISCPVVAFFLTPSSLHF